MDRWTIAFDADDTLWHTERDFALTQDRFAQMLAEFTAPDHLQERLLAAERRNLGIYGFGVKGFTLSMIETAIEVTDGNVPTEVIGDLLEMGRGMLAAPVEVLDGAEQAIKAFPVFIETYSSSKARERRRRGRALTIQCKLEAL